MSRMYLFIKDLIVGKKLGLIDYIVYIYSNENSSSPNYNYNNSLEEFVFLSSQQ